MTQCKDCVHGKELPDGTIRLTCDASRNIVEPECLTKWMLVSLRNVEAMQAYVLKLTGGMLPLQAKVLQHNCAQIDQLREGETWKHGQSDEDEPPT